MSLPLSCSRCLATALPSRQLPYFIPSTSRQFASTSSTSAAAKKAKSAAPVKKQGGSFNKGKSTGAGGKRSKETVALSVKSDLVGKAPNLNGMTPFTPENINSVEHMRFDTMAFEAITTFGIPRPLHKEFALSSPTTVPRVSTGEVYGRLEAALTGSSDVPSRTILTGSRGCGKTTILMQCATAAHMDGWIVIYIPRGISWTTSSAAYHYDAQSQTFHQTALSAQLLSAMVKVNGEALKEIVLEEEVRLGKVRAGDEEVVVQKGKTLMGLCEVGAREEALAPKVLEVVMGELERQSKFGVLLAIDEVQSLFTTSEITEPRSKRVPSWALSGARLFLDFIAGRRNFAKGATLTSISQSDPHHPIPRELSKALHLPTSRPISAYDKLDGVYLELARGAAGSAGAAHVKVAERLSPLEAAEMMRMWEKKNLVEPTDELFVGKYAESGGNAMEFTRGVFTSMGV